MLIDPFSMGLQFFAPLMSGLIAGMLAGGVFTRKGMSADTALEGRQPAAWLVLAVLAAVGVGLYTGWIQGVMPSAFKPYFGMLLPPGATILAAFVLTFVAFLPRGGESGAQRPGSTLLAVGLCTILLMYMGWLSTPVRPGQDLSAEGVVFQTTPYTCAAASIATVARQMGISPGLTEGAAAELARTTRGGTFAGGELRALRALGLNARFGESLTVDDLLAHDGPAVLHVREPLPDGRRIRHAVALLGVDAGARTITIGNPLEGVQMISFAELDGYWLGEAVLVDFPGQSD